MVRTYLDRDGDLYTTRPISLRIPRTDRTCLFHRPTNPFTTCRRPVNGYTDCKQVNDLVMKCWREEFGEASDRKTRLDYGKILDMRPEAVKRAKQHREASDQSWTEVYRVVERIDSFARAQPQ